MPRPSPGEEDRIGATARRYRRVSFLVAFVPPLVVSAMAVVADAGVVEYGLLFAAVAVYFGPVLVFEGRLELATDRPPHAVREALTGVENPLAASHRASAEAVEPIPGGAALTVSMLGFTGETRYEGVVQSDRVVSVTVWHGGNRFSTNRVVIDGDESGTNLTVRSRVRPRRSLKHLLVSMTGARYERRILAAQGYRVEETELSVGLLGGDR